MNHQLWKVEKYGRFLLPSMSQLKVISFHFRVVNSGLVSWECGFVEQVLTSLCRGWWWSSWWYKRWRRWQWECLWWSRWWYRCVWGCSFTHLVTAAAAAVQSYFSSQTSIEFVKYEGRQINKSKWTESWPNGRTHGQFKLVRWSSGPLVHWSIGPLDRWTIGPLVHWLNVKC